MSRSFSAARACGIVALIALVVVGCSSSGLSPREVRGQDYAGYVFSMYDPGALPANKNAALGATAATPAPRKPLVTPAKVAVAQLGEVAPPDALMKKLQTDTAAFASVQPVSGAVDVAPRPDYNTKPQDYSSQRNVQEHADRMRRYAADLGADYLFLFGGTLDQMETPTSATIANFTIIGMFIVPTSKLDADVRAAGSLVDVNTGRVVLSVSADGHETRDATYAGIEQSRRSMLQDLRKDVVEKLADQLSARVKERAAASTTVGG